MLRVGHDLDDSMAPWLYYVLERGRDQGYFEPDKSVEDSLAIFKEMDSKDFSKIYKDLVCNHKILLDIEPFPGEAELIKNLVWEGHQNVMITARVGPWCEGFEYEVRDQTIQWLDKHFGANFDAIIFNIDKACMFTNIFFDDNISNIARLAQAETLPIISDTKWNREHPDFDMQDIPRAFNASDKYDWVSKLAQDGTPEWAPDSSMAKYLSGERVSDEELDRVELEIIRASQ